MCGIVGWIDWKDDLAHQEATIERMVKTLRPRGPDAQGQWLSPYAALAHRRLIVIDPQTGEQPMVYREGDNTYTITYNGEIYNFHELRHELERYGHTFRNPLRYGGDPACLCQMGRSLRGTFERHLRLRDLG